MDEGTFLRTESITRQLIFLLLPTFWFGYDYDSVLILNLNTLLPLFLQNGAMLGVAL